MNKSKRSTLISVYRKLIATVSIFAFGFVVAGCPPTPNPPPNDADASQPAPQYDADPGDASLAALRACANLKMLGCQEGQKERCGETVDRVLETKITPFDIECVASAPNVEAVRKCPAIQCKK
jgi:hypothetical protein